MLAIILSSCVVFGASQAPGCPIKTCVMFCKNGIKKDANGCDTCSCAAGTPGQSLASLDCSQAPGWGWCPYYSQCVNPAQNPCPGGITSSPGVGSGGAVGVMPNPSVRTTTAAVGSHIPVDRPVDLPAELSPGDVDVHGCPPNYPWCAIIQSCAGPEHCGNADVHRAESSRVPSFATQPSFAFSGGLTVSAMPTATTVGFQASSSTNSQCNKKTCNTCRAYPGCSWHTTGQCLPYCRPDGTCLTLGQKCPKK